jgi:hypothetical protein
MFPYRIAKHVAVFAFVLVCVACSVRNVYSEEARPIEPVVIASGSESAAPMEPQIAIDETGDIHVTYGVDNRVYYCRSTNRGRSFETPMEVASVPHLSLGLRRGPRIVAKSSTLAISLIAGVQGKGRDGDLLVWYSSNQGSTWKGPAKVNAVAGSAREGLHGMAVSPQGVAWCTWLDLRNNKTEVYACSSKDGGKTWGENLLAYESPERNVCECCHPSIACNRDHVAVMFRNSLKGNRDMYVTLSSDGQPFGRAIKLDAESWRLNACPMDGGMIALDQGDQFEAIWMRSGSVYRFQSREAQEVLLGRGHQPWIAALGDRRAAVWTTGKRGDLQVLGGAFEEPHTIKGDCSNPCVAIGGQSKQPLAVACWQSKSGEKTTLFSLVIPWNEDVKR